VEEEQLHDAAAATRSCTEAKRAAAGQSRPEILLPPLLMTIRFLHMGVPFRRIPDIWQVIQRKEYKKTSIPGQKCRKASFSGTLSIAANTIAGLSRFCDISVLAKLKTG
jgi:hypothetical protein